MSIIQKTLAIYSRFRFLRILILLLITLAICYLSLANFKNLDEKAFNMPGLDKIVHFTLYFSYIIVLLINNSIDWKARVVIVIGYCIFFGAFMELLQTFVFTYRSGDYLDMTFNIFGTLIGYFLFYKFIQLKLQ